MAYINSLTLKSVDFSFAPVVLFAYARLEHLCRVVESLRANQEAGLTSLYVFCDGPRHESNKVKTDAVREYVNSIDGFASVTRVYREQNLGLAQSIISGVSEILSEHNALIVMEDDLVVSPYFLKFMNDGLQLYREDERVASIHGYCFPVEQELPETFFLRGADCWGWATWARAWRHFEPDGQKLLNALRRERLTRAFDLDGAYPYIKMLANQVAGKNDSWAVRWHASCFIDNMLTLYPGRSLVNNIGSDDSGTHCSKTDVFDQVVAVAPINVLPVEIQENVTARDSFARFLGQYTSLSARAKRAIIRIGEALKKS